jgi:nucleotide-binding universal stress UspA family protein
MTADRRIPVFARIVCGVDATPESLDAVRQAVRLRPPEAKLHLFGAVYIAGAIAQGWPKERVTQELEQEAGDALRRAAALTGEDVTTRLFNGAPAESLLAELEREQATLVCVGRHTRRRLLGLALGYVATTMLHDAPCSVLIARKPPDPEAFPQSIVVGVDGSAQAAAAHAVASELARRFDAKLTPLSAYGGKYVDTEALSTQLPDLVLERTRPVEALRGAAASTDLLVVGSRGVHGLRALGSVSERIAHHAECSVLVVRGPSVE